MTPSGGGDVAVGGSAASADASAVGFSVAGGAVATAPAPAAVPSCFSGLVTQKRKMKYRETTCLAREKTAKRRTETVDSSSKNDTPKHKRCTPETRVKYRLSEATQVSTGIKKAASWCSKKETHPPPHNESEEGKEASEENKQYSQAHTKQRGKK